MLTPKHTIWDEIPNAVQIYKKINIKKWGVSFSKKIIQDKLKKRI
jgi:hypothetical protein